MDQGLLCAGRPKCAVASKAHGNSVSPRTWRRHDQGQVHLDISTDGGFGRAGRPPRRRRRRLACLRLGPAGRSSTRYVRRSHDRRESAPGVPISTGERRPGPVPGRRPGLDAAHAPELPDAGVEPPECFPRGGQRHGARQRHLQQHRERRDGPTHRRRPGIHGGQPGLPAVETRDVHRHRGPAANHPRQRALHRQRRVAPERADLRRGDVEDVRIAEDTVAVLVSRQRQSRHGTRRRRATG